MSFHPEKYYQPPVGEEFSPFINNMVPSLDASHLYMNLIVGDQRASLLTPTTGDMSLLLSYKGREAFVASFVDQGEALGVVQLQGAARGKGYRVATGLRLVQLFASQIESIVANDESPYREVYMPSINMIEGVEVAVSDLASSRYQALAAELGMRFSSEEQLFLRKIK